MFPSSNNGNVDPIYNYNDQQIYNRSLSTFFNDISSSFKQQQQDHHLLQEQISSSFPFLPFLGSLLEFQDHFDTSFHNNQLPLKAISAVGVTDIVNMSDSEGMFNVKTEICCRKSCNKRNISHVHHEMNNEPKKKTSKKDRHSKINTAQGPRDRRMRLSLKVAREFFDLQDKLGFDKGSKTVEWLLIQAKDAIIKLTQSVINQNVNYSSKTASSTNNSDCEVVSHAVDAVSTMMSEAAAAATAAVSTNQESVSETKTTACVKKTRRKTREVRKSAVTKTTSKETREKARARARERTQEKQKMIEESNSKMINEEEKEIESNNNLSSFETTGEESVTQSHTINNSISTTSMDILTEIEDGQICSSDDIHNQQESRFNRLFNSMVIMKKWSPSISINDHLYNTSIHEELQNDDQIADFQYGFSRSWDDQMGHHS